MLGKRIKINFMLLLNAMIIKFVDTQNFIIDLPCWPGPQQCPVNPQGCGVLGEESC